MTGFVEVRSVSDIEKTADIARASWNDTYCDIIGNEQTEYMIETFQSFGAIQNALNKGEQYFLMTFMNEYCGYICIVPEGKRMFLSKLYVLPEFKRKGVATDALEFIKEQCRISDIDTIYLTVNRNNHDALKYYRKSGFVNIRDQVKEIGSGFVMDDHIMELTVR